MLVKVNFYFSFFSFLVALILTQYIILPKIKMTLQITHHVFSPILYTYFSSKIFIACFLFALDLYFFWSEQDNST